MSPTEYRSFHSFFSLRWFLGPWTLVYLNSSVNTIQGRVENVSLVTWCNANPVSTWTDKKRGYWTEPPFSQVLCHSIQPDCETRRRDERKDSGNRIYEHPILDHQGTILTRVVALCLRAHTFTKLFDEDRPSKKKATPSGTKDQVGRETR